MIDCPAASKLMRFVAVVILAQGFALPTLALNRDKAISELQHTGWTVRDGAPAAGVNSIAQTKDGYLWLASYSGLFRFDGLRFDRITLNRDERLRSMTVYDVFAPESGGLWLGFAYGGAGFVDEKGRLTVYTAQDGLPNAPAIRFTESLDGTVWVSTRAGIGQFKEGHWHSLPFDSSVSDAIHAASLDSLLADSDGTLWMSLGHLIYHLPRDEKEFSGPIRGFTGYVTLSESPTGALWASDDQGLRFIHQSAHPSGKPRCAEYSIQFDRDGALWAMNLDGLHRLAHPEMQTEHMVSWKSIPDIYTSKNGLTSEHSYRSALEDREGNFWVATGEGIDRFSERILVSVPLPLNLDDGQGQGLDLAVAPGDDGSVWITGGSATLHRSADGHSELFSLMKDVTSISRTRDGSIWAGANDTIWTHQSNDWTRTELPAGTEGAAVQALAMAGDGTLWLSVVHHDVYARTGGAWLAFGGLDLPKSVALTMSVAPDGRAWMGYPDNRLAVVDKRAVTLYSTAEGLNVGNVTGLFAATDHVWVGGEFGLEVLNHGRLREVLPEVEHAFDGATGIVETHEGDLWINGSAGITHIDARATRAALDSPNIAVNSETFDSTDGLSGTGARRMRPLPTLIEGSDQRLWFVTNTGLFNVDPQHISRNPNPPKVHIQGVVVGEHVVPPVDTLTLPKSTTAMRVDYVGLSLSRAEKVRYRYQLEGVDQQWQDAKARHQAFYTNLSPGHYRFHVIASNNDGVWNKEGASMDIIIPPTFWQTKVFAVLCVAIGIVLIALLFRIRLTQSASRLRSLLNERLDERERIARELHDTLLQGTEGLMLQLQAAAHLIPHNEPAHTILERAMDSADDVMMEGRDRVLDLRVPIESYRSLTKSIEAVIEQLRISTTVAQEGRPSLYRMVIEGSEREVLPDIRHEVYCIAREALLNASRHAAARLIEVKVVFAGDALRLVVSDDGAGIDTAIAEARSRSGHWGLAGMRERAKNLGAQLEFRKAPKGGTEIEIAVPGDVAYRHRERSFWLSLKSLVQKRRSL